MNNVRTMLKSAPDYTMRNGKHIRFYFFTLDTFDSTKYSMLQFLFSCAQSEKNSTNHKKLIIINISLKSKCAL